VGTDGVRPAVIRWSRPAATWCSRRPGAPVEP